MKKLNFPNKLFELPSTTSLFFIFGLIVILISLGLTIKKILLKKGSMISGDNAHAKV